MMCSWFMENQGLTFLAQGQHGPIFGHILHKPFKTDASVPYTALHIQIDNCGEILGQE